MARHATNLEMLKLREHEEVQWTKHGSRSDSEAQHPDLTSRRGVLGGMRVCTMSTSQIHYHQHSTTTKGWRSAPDIILPGHRRAPQWVPGKDTNGTLGPEQRGSRGWPKGRNAHGHDAYSRQSNTQVFRQTIRSFTTVLYK